MSNYVPTTEQARKSIKSLRFELSNLTPSSLVTFFEIDISEIIKDKKGNLLEDIRTVKMTEGAPQDGILRFHNNIKVFNSYIKWQGQTYYPAPIKAEGFESNSKGALPQPTLTIASQSESGIDQLALLKYEIRKIGDIVGAKVTRKRTFAKYLDPSNWGNTEAQLGKESNTLPNGFEPDPFAYLPSDIYFIERKQTENKTIITYQLSSVLDLEGTKLPKRSIIADKCVWQYRGMGCWYQHPETNELQNYPTSTEVPILKKAELKTIKPLPDPAGGEYTADNIYPDQIASTSSEVDKVKATGLLKEAPPVATDSDEPISDIIGGGNIQLEGLYKVDKTYSARQSVYLQKDNVKYYFVAVKNVPKNTPPPNKLYWVADECSKSLTGCRLRWGVNSPRTTHEEHQCPISVGQLPYGGFPAAKKLQRSVR
tara:strand:+ start:425 stop:1702 length:1278 start_codon:yes stop_codon:yes gene_type:complete